MSGGDGAGQVIVTGAFGSLGSAVVAALRDRGSTVAAVDLAPAPAGANAGDASEFGGIDLTDPAAVARCFAGIAAAGPVAGLVNVAGGFVWQTVADGGIDGWDRMYRTNLRTAAVACAAAIPLLADGGAIVTIGAAAVHRPGIGMAAYAASKAGVVALTESLAEELRPRGIRANAILPTIINTAANRADMPDADPSQWVAPAQLADVVAFLLSDAADCITGATIRTR